MLGRLAGRSYAAQVVLFGDTRADNGSLFARVDIEAAAVPTRGTTREKLATGLFMDTRWGGPGTNS